MTTVSASHRIASHRNAIKLALRRIHSPAYIRGSDWTTLPDRGEGGEYAGASLVLDREGRRDGNELGEAAVSVCYILAS